MAMCFIAFYVLDAQGAFVYWIEANFAAPKLVMADGSGSITTTLTLANGSLPQALAISPGTNAIYWTELSFLNAHVKFAHADLTDSAAAVSLQSCARGIAVDSTNKKVYWSSTNLSAGPAIFRANLDGTSAEQIQSFGSASRHTPFGIAVDEKTQTLFWTDFGSGAIEKAPAAPLSAPLAIMTGLGGPVGIVFDADSGLLFWTDANAGTIGRSKADGSGAITIVTNCARPQYIGIDRGGQRLYWTEFGASRVRSSGFDGNDTLTLAQTAFPPCGIAVSAGASTLSRQNPAPRIPHAFAVAVDNPADRLSGRSIRIRYQLPTQSRVVIEVFDLRSSRVFATQPALQAAGSYTRNLNAPQALVGGTYIVRFVAGDFRSTFRSTMRLTMVR